ncbi:MAG: T9SS type A sorting domain-containing protein [Bacteroidota bacterium]
MQKIILSTFLLLFICDTAFAVSQRAGTWRWRADDGDIVDATWLAPENTTLITDETGIIRLRWEMSDEDPDLGGASSFTNSYQLRVGLVGDGTAVMTPVTTTSSPFRLADSPNLIDEDVITDDLLTDCVGSDILPGAVIESDGNRSMTFVGNVNNVLENEWVIQANGAVLGTDYLFKLTGIAPGSNFDWSPAGPPNGPTCAEGGATLTFDISAPVTYLSFRGEEISEGVKISWSTEAELNNSHFELRRSQDFGRVFQTIATIDGKGNTTTRSDYAFLDKDFLAGAANYYQLRQVDFDGQYEDSQFVIVNTKGEADIIIGEAYPNPNETGMLYLDVYTASDRRVGYTVYDQLGQAIMSNEVVLAEGQQRLQFNTSQLPTGHYYVRLESGILLNRALRFTVR